MWECVYELGNEREREEAGYWNAPAFKSIEELLMDWLCKENTAYYIAEFSLSTSVTDGRMDLKTITKMPLLCFYFPYIKFKLKGSFS